MRIVYIAGFFAPLLEHLQAQIGELLAERSVVWVRQRSDGQPDINALKADLFDQAARGASEILICVFVFRQHEFLLTTLENIAAAATTRYSGIRVDIRRFKNAQDKPGVLKAVRDFGPDRQLVFPSSLDALERWAEDHWANKVVLHPRALRGAKQSLFLDNDLVYRSLQLLAEEYWNMRNATLGSARGHKAAFEGKLESLGIELAPSISPARAGEQGDELLITYPLGGTAKCLMDLHLKKGSDRDERNCLRIYFLWDDRLKLVVVGWLPSHLATRNS